MIQGIVENNEAWPLISEIELLNVFEERVNEDPTHIIGCHHRVAMGINKAVPIREVTQRLNTV